MPAPSEVIRDAVISVINGLSYPYLVTDSIKHRKRPQRIDGDPERLCLVVMDKELDAGRSNMTRLVWYAALVVLIRKQARTVIKSDGWVEGARETIRTSLHTSLLLGPNGYVRLGEYEPEPEFPQDGFEAGFDVSGQRFWYKVEQP